MQVILHILKTKKGYATAHPLVLRLINLLHQEIIHVHPKKLLLNQQGNEIRALDIPRM